MSLVSKRIDAAAGECGAAKPVGERAGRFHQ